MSDAKNRFKNKNAVQAIGSSGMRKYFLTVLAISFLAISCKSIEPNKAIILFGEEHGIGWILDKEFDMWQDLYVSENLRHLFVELPYYDAEFMNLWMKSDNDGIYNTWFQEKSGTAIYTPSTYEFYKRIKSECPETVFHGTDLGHQYDTSGRRFLDYLTENGLEDTEQYNLTLEAITQGEYFYGGNADADFYRENIMAQNFIREFDKLGNSKIMGIYGGAHTDYNSSAIFGDYPNMAKQLYEHYGDIIYFEIYDNTQRPSEQSEITAIQRLPERTDKLVISGKEYTASYFGIQELGIFNFAHREYWRLEDAYDDFKDKAKTNDVLPYSNFTFGITAGQVFVIDYTMTDGTVERKYYRSDGNVWNGQPVTEEFLIE